MLNWDAHKQREKPERESVLDGIPQALPALALADKVLGKVEKLGLIDASDTPAIPTYDEAGASNSLESVVTKLFGYLWDPRDLEHWVIGSLGHWLLWPIIGFSDPRVRVKSLLEDRLAGPISLVRAKP